MGGLSGHMMHLYDDPELKFKDLRKFIIDAFNNNVEFIEKVDGFNIHVSYQNGRVRYYRNKTDVKNGGMTREDLKEKYKDKPGTWRVYNAATKILEPFIESVKELFKWDASQLKTMNVECVDGLTNIIPYKGSFVCIHNFFIWDRKDGHIVADETLHQWNIPILRQYLPSDNSIRLPKRVNILGESLEKMASGTLCQMFIKRLNQIVGGTKSMYEYAREQYKTTDGGFFDSLKNPDLQQALVLKVVFGISDPGLGRELKEVKDLVKDYYKQSFDEWYKTTGRSIARAIKFQMICFTTELGIYLMDRSYGYYNFSNKYLTCAIIDRQANAAENELKKTHNTPVDPWIMWDFYFNRHINPLEGLVFKLNDQCYKLTGAFAFLNKFIGMIKYGRC